MTIPASRRLRAQRKRWAFSQRELAFLCGLSTQGVVAHHEAGTRTPRADILLAYETLFDTPASELLPPLKQDARTTLTKRVHTLRERLDTETGRSAERKKQFLDDVAKRMSAASS